MEWNIVVITVCGTADSASLPSAASSVALVRAGAAGMDILSRRPVMLQLVDSYSVTMI